MSVANVKKSQPYNIYIGRENNFYHHEASEWANPYVMDEWHTRDMVLGLYYWHLIANPNLYDATKELRGKTLGCYCAPLPCHGDLLTWLSEGHKLPTIYAPHNWQECQFCGAPFVLWRDEVNPVDVMRSGSREGMFDPHNYLHINGTPPDVRQIVGCMTCGKVGLYAMTAAQLRSGSLALHADQVLRDEAALQRKIAPFKAKSRR